MKTMKTSELTGAALDWAVGKAIGAKVSKLGPGNKVGVWIIEGESWYETRKQYTPSTEWAQGGPIIEREWLDITPWPNQSDEDMRWHCQQHDTANDCAQYGPTPLIAAMRCYVASKLGDTVEVPKEIL